MRFNNLEEQKTNAPFLLKIVSLQANIRIVFFDQKSPPHPEVSVLRWPPQKDRRTDIHGNSMADPVWLSTILMYNQISWYGVSKETNHSLWMIKDHPLTSRLCKLDDTSDHLGLVRETALSQHHALSHYCDTVSQL